VRLGRTQTPNPEMARLLLHGSAELEQSHPDRRRGAVRSAAGRRADGRDEASECRERGGSGADDRASAAAQDSVTIVLTVEVTPSSTSTTTM